MPLTKLFDLPIPPTCHYIDALNDWYDRPSRGDQRIMAHSIAHEHRVSPRRRTSFEAGIPIGCSSDDLEMGLRRYWETYVRSKTPPHFLMPAFNELNFAYPIRVGPKPLASRAHISPDLQLARVVNLNGLLHGLRMHGLLTHGPLQSWLAADTRKVRRHGDPCG